MTVIATCREVYLVEASDPDKAEELWAEGELIDTDDDVESEIVSVEKVWRATDNGIG